MGLFELVLQLCGEACSTLDVAVLQEHIVAATCLLHAANSCLD